MSLWRYTYINLASQVSAVRQNSKLDFTKEMHIISLLGFVSIHLGWLHIWLHAKYTHGFAKSTTALSDWTKTTKIFPILRSLLLSLAFLLLLPLLYSRSLSHYEPVIFWNLAISLTQTILTQILFFFFFLLFLVFCPIFLFNLQKLHDDLCRYHTSIVVFFFIL